MFDRVLNTPRLHYMPRHNLMKLNLRKNFWNSLLDFFFPRNIREKEALKEQYVLKKVRKKFIDYCKISIKVLPVFLLLFLLLLFFCQPCKRLQNCNSVFLILKIFQYGGLSSLFY